MNFISLILKCNISCQCSGNIPIRFLRTFSININWTFLANVVETLKLGFCERSVLTLTEYFLPMFWKHSDYVFGDIQNKHYLNISWQCFVNILIRFLGTFNISNNWTFLANVQETFRLGFLEYSKWTLSEYFLTMFWKHSD